MNRNSANMIEISTILGIAAPFSPLWAAAGPEGLLLFDFGINRADFVKAVRQRWPKAEIRTTAEPHPALSQVLEYLSGSRRDFTLVIDQRSFTPFQRAVYQVVQQIPYGQTASYGQIAKQLGRPPAARAVGAANAANPLPLIIPCHRLIGMNGELRGYGGAGGTDTKAWLLAFERENASKRDSGVLLPN